MAKTFKFGENGKWATKTGSSMAYNDQNGNFKPMPFSVTRDSIATRVNKQGLIEVVGNDKLRIDYKDSSNGVALLEPARTNIQVYSEDYSNVAWGKSNTSVTANSIASPDGEQTAEKITTTVSGATQAPNLFSQSGYRASVTSGASYSFSYFAKAGSTDYAKLRISGSGFTTYSNDIIFNTTTGNIISGDATIDVLTNGWVRIKAVATANATGEAVLAIDLPDKNGNWNVGSNYDGDEFIYAWGAQIEAGSYATSYIPTSGSTYEREADVANGAGNAQVFNDSEGVLFANIASLSDTISTYNSIGVGSGSTYNRIGLGFEAPSNIYVFKQTTASWLTSTTKNIKLYNKVALSYNTNDNHFWLNGFKIASNTTIGDISQPNELGFEASYGGEQFYGKAKEVGVYDAVLTDAELEALTSYTSFTNMANELNLTIK